MHSIRTTPSERPPSNAHAFEQSLACDVAQRQLPGAVVAQLQHANRVIHAIGFRDAELGLPMREDSIFRIHSLTKPVVSLGVLMLMEKGRLSLDDKLSDFLPVFSRLRLDGHPNARPQPTIRHLLTHTAGFTYEFMGSSPIHKQYADAGLVFGRMTNEEFCNRISEIPLLFEPGAKWHYSHATDILGRLVETITGKTLAEHLSETIFSPLGMQDTSFAVVDNKLNRVANPFPHDPETSGRLQLSDPRRPVVQEMGGHGLYSTAPDYLKFLELLATKGQFEKHRLVEEPTIDLMFSSQTRSVSPVSSAMSPQDHFGAGLAVRRQSNADMAYWFGWSGTCFAIDPIRQEASLFLVQQPATRDHYISQFLDSLSIGSKQK